MLQNIHGIDLYIVDFDTMPVLPITWTNPAEELYARALTDAIQEGVITEPGKYGIRVSKNDEEALYDIFQIHE